MPRFKSAPSKVVEYTRQFYKEEFRVIATMIHDSWKESGDLDNWNEGGALDNWKDNGVLDKLVDDIFLYFKNYVY